MWNGKMKALTFSYDDGVEQDIRLIEILDHYHLRGTFNLNPGLQSPEHTFQKGSVTVRHLPHGLHFLLASDHFLENFIYFAYIMISAGRYDQFSFFF